MQLEEKAKPRVNGSLVWNYMKKVSSREAMCTLCGRHFSQGNGTSNLLRHLVSKHGVDELEQTQPLSDRAKKRQSMTMKSQLTLMSPGAMLAKYVKNEQIDTKPVETPKYFAQESNRKENLDKLVLAMIVEDLESFTMVENTGFKRLVAALDPKYPLPSKRLMVDKFVPQAYQDTKHMVRTELQSAASMSTSVEIWSHREGQTFMSVSCHFVSNAWGLKSVLLECTRLEDNYTSNSIASELYRVFESWEISSKVFCITTDDSAEMAAAVAQLNINHQVCFAHTLNSVIHQAIKNVGGLDFLREKVSDVLMFFKTNTNATDTLLALQHVKGKSTLKLETNLDSKWTSMFDVFKRYIELHKCVTQALNSLSKQDLIISDQDLQLMKDCVTALEPFDAVAMELSEDNLISLSKVLPTTKSLTRYINNNPVSGHLAEELKNHLNQQFYNLETNMFHSAATYLDPRFRELAFDGVETCANVQDELKTMMDLDGDQAVAMPGEQPVQKKPAISVSLWSDFDMRAQSTRSPTVSLMKTQSSSDFQFGKYESEPLILRLDNPLEWWQVKMKTFPSMCKVAKQFLGVPATCVPPNRLFTKEGQNWTAKRSNLEESSVNTILFLNQNCKEQLQ